MHVVNTVAPVFLVIALGFALRRGGFLTAQFITGMTRLAYWVGLPALLFQKVAVAEQIEKGFGNSFVIVLAGIGGCIAVAYIAARLVRMPASQSGAFVQAAFRGNMTFMGLAIVLYAFGGDQGHPAQTIAVLTLAPIVPVHNILAVTVLLAARHKLSWSAVGKIARQIATNPLLLACAAGMVWSLAGLELPAAADRALSIAGQFALPVALIAIGGTLAQAKLTGRIGRSALAAVIKVGVAPVVGCLAAMAIGAGPTETAVALILLACPTAVASYVLTDQLDGDAALASGAIVVSTILSIVSLSVVLAVVN